MANPAHVMIAISGVFLVAWYGTRRLDRRRAGMPSLAEPDAPGDGYCRAAAAALAAEMRTDSGSAMPGGTVECVECGTPYPAGVPFCACGGETAESEDPDDPHAGEETTTAPPAELVCVHVADTPWKANLLKTMLESNDIPCATGGNAGVGPYQFAYGPMGEVRLLVHAHDARQARALIARCLQAP